MPLLADTLWRLLLPAACLGCGTLEPHPQPLGLCLRCRGRLPASPQAACATCGRALPAAALPDGYRCGGCRGQGPPALTRVVAPWSYHDPLARVLWAYKFRRLDYLAADLAAALALALRPVLASAAGAGAGAAVEAPTLVVPVPLHWWRRFLRGYDQAALLAAGLARELGLPYVDGLERRRATERQSELARGARRRNLRRAFAVRPDRRGRLAGARVVLVDDVITTGATVEAAAACLARAGAAEIIAVAVARTPPPDHTEHPLRGVTRRGPSAPPGG